MTDEDDIAQRVDGRIDQVQDIYQRQGKVVRVMWIAAAVLVVLAGLVMAVVPGPATVVVPLGLAMLAAVFGWTRRLLMFSVRKGVKAKKVVEDTDTKVKVLGLVALACLAAAVIALIVLWSGFVGDFNAESPPLNVLVSTAGDGPRIDIASLR